MFLMKICFLKVQSISLYLDKNEKMKTEYVFGSDYQEETFDAGHTMAVPAKRKFLKLTKNLRKLEKQIRHCAY